LSGLGAEALDRLRGELGRRVAVEIPKGRLRRACVVVPIIATPGNWRVLFTQRGAQLSSHGGQISFPGGVVERGEALEDAAIREMEEEVGIPRASTELLGRLDDLITHSGFVVAPFVGLIPESFRYLLQQDEVVEAFEVPIETLLADPNPEIRSVEFKGRLYPSYFFHYDGREIWGLTGRMLQEFLDVVRVVV